MKRHVLHLAGGTHPEALEHARNEPDEPKEYVTVRQIHGVSPLMPVAVATWSSTGLRSLNVGVLGQAGGATTRAWGWGDGPLAIASVLVLLVPIMMLVMFYRHGSAEAR
jgi:hypothetical protein